VPFYKTCDKLQLLVDLAEAKKVTDQNSTRCNTEHTQRDSIIMHRCNAPHVWSWKQGGQVSIYFVYSKIFYFAARQINVNCNYAFHIYYVLCLY
jgi:hypothetical protein